ncbi:mannitol dehydrogenase family protein [Frondihabitans australicus]|uniref:Fructuronate reductase n=1 Tax=Frondihabitans australicus TaxID=386892 RepID=A0A495IG91_9MICO|nr:mannitol dehydrogenase family protein [Frondihabitans australicus]RKR74351.1 fructuronate reductase [Frondihabitans australicus]
MPDVSPLTAAALSAPARAVREQRRPGVVHLGLGAFHRSHQAWYTQRAGGSAGSVAAAGSTGAAGSQEPTGERPWGIVAFTGRRPDAAATLAEQDCVYTLVTRSADGDEASLVDAIVAAHDGGDSEVWRAAVASPETAVITLTVTEAAYRHVDGGADLAAPDVMADIDALRRGESASTVPGRLVDGLRARRGADAGTLAVVSCDNLTGNGDIARDVVLSVANAVDSDLAAWIRANASFVSSMVDRITPATTEADRADATRLTGFDDRAVVVAEPFAEWVLSTRVAADGPTDAFPAGRPAWESAGAVFVDDLEPYEHRKLWLLNAGHSLLAYLGPLLGHETIDEAMSDPRCTEPLEQLWDEAAEVLPLPADEIDDARAALRERFRNPRIRHRLRQIAADGSVKLPVRVVAPLRERLARGLPVGPGAATALAAWHLHVSRQADLVSDRGAAGLGAESSVSDVLELLAPDLATRPEPVAAVEAAEDRILRLLDTPDRHRSPQQQGAPA